jgi:hypothetical protein
MKARQRHKNLNWEEQLEQLGHWQLGHVVLVDWGLPSIPLERLQKVVLVGMAELRESH